jgi:hypothetical protein
MLSASLSGNTWDREFESCLLQRRVACEPDFLDQGRSRSAAEAGGAEAALQGPRAP